MAKIIEQYRTNAALIVSNVSNGALRLSLEGAFVVRINGQKEFTQALDLAFGDKGTMPGHIANLKSETRRNAVLVASKAEQLIDSILNNEENINTPLAILGQLLLAELSHLGVRNQFTLNKYVKGTLNPAPVQAHVESPTTPSVTAPDVPTIPASTSAPTTADTPPSASTPPSTTPDATDTTPAEDTDTDVEMATIYIDQGFIEYDGKRYVPEELLIAEQAECAALREEVAMLREQLAAKPKSKAKPNLAKVA